MLVVTGVFEAAERSDHGILKAYELFLDDEDKV